MASSECLPSALPPGPSLGPSTGAGLPSLRVHVESPHQPASAPSSSFQRDPGSRIPRPLIGSSLRKIPAVFFPVWLGHGWSRGPRLDVGAPSALPTPPWDFLGLVCNTVCIWVSSYSIVQCSQLEIHFALQACTSASTPKVWIRESDRSGHADTQGSARPGPGAVVTTHGLSTTTLRSGDCCYPWFTDEKSKAQGVGHPPGSHSQEMTAWFQSQGPDHWTFATGRISWRNPCSGSVLLSVLL